MREHAFSYFSKPFSSESLAGMIRSAAEGPCWDEGIEVLSATPKWIRVAVSCDLRTAERLVQFINEIADLPDTEREDVAIAFREILLNAIEHGAHFNSNEFVEISYLRARHMVICRVKDPGEGFHWIKSAIRRCLIRPRIPYVMRRTARRKANVQALWCSGG